MIPYGSESIDEDFRKAHSEILSVKRGNGLWIWKPYIVIDALGRVNEGDYVFYCDSGAFFVDSVMPLIQSMGDCDVWVSDISMVEEQWTKPEVFRLLGIEDREDINNSRQVQASCVLCRKSEQSVSFIREWLELCVRPELIVPLNDGEYRGECIEHREDQSLLSILSKLNGIKAHKSPFFLPAHPGYATIRSIIKAQIKAALRKLSLLKQKPIRPNTRTARQISRTEDDNDKYSEYTIYHHRIRQAKNMYQMWLQVITGMGIRRFVNIFCRCSRQDKNIA